MTKSKKRILFFIPTFPVASETFIEREVYKLVERNQLDIEVVALNSAGEFNYRELEFKAKYAKLKFSDVALGLISFLLGHPTRLLKAFNYSRQNNKKSFLLNIYMVLKAVGYAYVLKTISAQQLHAHFFSEASTLGFLIAILLDIKFSMSGHAKDVFGLGEHGPELIKQKVSYSEFVVLCNKRAYLSCLSQVGEEDRTKVYIEHHGVDFSVLTKLKLFSKTPDSYEWDIFFQGRYVEKKGLIYLLTAVKTLADQNVFVKLAIVGFGKGYEQYQNYVNTYGLNDRIYFVNLGKAISNDALLLEMNKAKIIVSPNIDASGDSDGVPNIILEAGMLSKPVITTNAGSIEELVINGESGLIVDQKDSNQIATAILKLRADSSLGARIGFKLHELVKANFDLDINITKLEKLLLGTAD